MDETPPFHFGAVILAAGRSSRMGQPKTLLKWGGTSVLGQLIRLWQEAGAAQIAVVCAEKDTLVIEELDRLMASGRELIRNPDPDRGMFSSIVCAACWAGWNPQLTHWAIALGDQPHLKPATLERLVGYASQHPTMVCQPLYAEKRAHPVLMPKMLFKELVGTRAVTLKQFLASHTVGGCACDDPGLTLDIDRPEDYARALVLAGIPLDQSKQA